MWYGDGCTHHYRPDLGSWSQYIKSLTNLLEVSWIVFCAFAHDLFTVAAELLYQSVFVPIIIFPFSYIFLCNLLSCVWVGKSTLNFAALPLGYMQYCITVVGLFLCKWLYFSWCTHTHMHSHMHPQCFLVWLIWFTYALVLIVLYTPGFHTGYFAGGGWFVFDLRKGVWDLQDSSCIQYQAVFHLHALRKKYDRSVRKYMTAFSVHYAILWCSVVRCCSMGGLNDYVFVISRC